MRLSLRFHCLPVLAAVALAQPASTAWPRAAPDLLEHMLALRVASELVGARDAATFARVESAAGVRNVWVGAKGRSARQVTAFAEDDGQFLYDVALRKDGAAIAFVRGGDPEYADEELPNAGRDPAAPAQRVYVGSTQGGAATAIRDGHSPLFAPDGRIAFTRKGEVWLWQAGRGAVRIATVAGEVRHMSFSPDGRSLASAIDRWRSPMTGTSKRLEQVEPGPALRPYSRGNRATLDFYRLSAGTGNHFALYR